MISREQLNALRERYPPGSQIVLRRMVDDPDPIPPGTVGTLTLIDDAGQFHTDWRNGRSLAVILGVDQFDVTPPEMAVLKIYSPMTAELYEYDETASAQSEDPVEVNGSAILEFQDEIKQAMDDQKSPEEAERGVMHWYQKDDIINRKVHSITLHPEYRDDRAWCVAECRIIGDLTGGELNDLKGYVSSCLSDGIGESIESNLIDVGRDTLCIHVWKDRASVQTERELFGLKLQDFLPPMCYSVLPSSGALIGIRRGESGYFLAMEGTGDRAANEAVANQENKRLGVTPEQRMAMEIGSLCGWDAPGANPRMYEGRLSQEGPGAADGETPPNHDGKGHKKRNRNGQGHRNR